MSLFGVFTSIAIVGLVVTFFVLTFATVTAAMIPDSPKDTTTILLSVKAGGTIAVIGILLMLLITWFPPTNGVEEEVLVHMKTYRLYEVTSESENIVVCYLDEEAGTLKTARVDTLDVAADADLYNFEYLEIIEAEEHIIQQWGFITHRYTKPKTLYRVK